MGHQTEVGTDMTQFATHQNLSSGACVCPGNNESAGKKYSSKITHGNKYLKTTLVEAAWVAFRSRANPLLAVKHHQIAARRGQSKATIATPHKILIAAYHVLRDMEPYQLHPQDIKILENRRLKRIDRLQKQLCTLRNTAYK